jgi:hypothetical protein
MIINRRRIEPIFGYEYLISHKVIISINFIPRRNPAGEIVLTDLCSTLPHFICSGIPSNGRDTVPRYYRFATEPPYMMDGSAFVAIGGSSFSASRSGTASSRSFSARAVTTRPACERNGRVSHSPRRARSVSMGLIPFVPDWIALGGWFYGAYRFYLGFNETSYQKVGSTCRPNRSRSHPNSSPSYIHRVLNVCGGSARSMVPCIVVFV